MDRNAALLRAMPLPELAPILAVGEVGCGAGQRCRLWAMHGHQVVGVDADPQQIAVARRMAIGLPILFDPARAQALPWPSRCLDVCLVHGALRSAPDWPACLAELTRVLRPGGALLLNRGSWEPFPEPMARFGLRSRPGSPLAFKIV